MTDRWSKIILFAPLVLTSCAADSTRPPDIRSSCAFRIDGRWHHVGTGFALGAAPPSASSGLSGIGLGPGTLSPLSFAVHFQKPDTPVGSVIRLNVEWKLATADRNCTGRTCSSVSWSKPNVSGYRIGSGAVAVAGNGPSVLTQDGPSQTWLFDWTLGQQPGDQAIQFEACDYDSQFTAYPAYFVLGVHAIPAPAARIEPFGNSPVAQPDGSVKPDPAVRAVDQFGNPVPQTTVDFLISPNDGSVSATSVPTDAAGVATVSWDLASAKGNGPFGLRATAPNVPAPNNNVQFIVNKVPAASALLSIAAGDNQIAPAGTPVPVAPAVQIVDKNGPVPGVAVTFIVLAGAGVVIVPTGQASSAVRTTDAAGIASLVGWRMGAVGANLLEARVSAPNISPTSLAFSATATARGAVQLFDDFDRSGLGNWDANIATIPPGVTSVGHAVANRPSGGNPLGYRHMTHMFTAATPTFVTMEVRHLYNTTYDPKTGPIDSLVYGEDRVRFVPNAGDIGSAAIIEQNGVIHVAPLTGGIFSDAAWNPIRVKLLASDFTPKPDFSVNGAPMRFGFMRSNSQRFPITLEHGIDNWSVAIWR